MAYKCGAARDLPMNMDMAWDGNAAAQSIFDANSDVDGHITDGARKGFLCFDADQADKREAYRLPFAQVLNGRLTALGSGVRAAASRLPQTEGLSPDERDSARGFVDGYLEKMHEESQTDEERAAGGVMLARMPIETRIHQPTSREELPPELLAQVRDRSILESGMPYMNQAWGSTDRVDTYHTRMMPSTLRNYAQDATDGIAIQNSHKSDELSLGRTYAGTYKSARNGGISRTEMDFYIPPDLVINGTATNHVIDGIRWGTINDVSVGFYGGEVRCSMCDKPMFRDIGFLLFFGGGDDEGQESRDPDAPCHHIPGVEYAMRDHQGKRTGDRQVAIGQIEDAHCAELSFVFDGSTPKAEIRGRQAPALAKAVRMVELDLLPRRPALALETSFRGQRLLASVINRRWTGYSVDPDDQPAPDIEIPEPEPQPDPGPDPEPEPESEPESVPVPQPEAEVTTMSESSDRVQQVEADAATSTRATEPVSDPLIGIRTQMISAGLAADGFQGDVGQRFRELGTELQELRDWADVGRQAREKLVEDCRGAGVRAFGKNGLPESAYGDLLTRGSFQALQGLFTHLNELGATRFQAGRATEDGESSTSVPPELVGTDPSRVPARAFRA